MDIFYDEIPSPGGYMIPVRGSIRPGQTMAVIIAHGFASSMESSTAGLMIDHLDKMGIGAVAFDFPCHGSSRAEFERLTVPNCLADMAAVERWVLGRAPGCRIGYFGSSFGAYITLCHLCSESSRGRRAFLRCAALDMDATFTPGARGVTPMDGYYKYDPGFGEGMKLTQEFFDGLASRHPLEMALPAGARLAMIHGLEDEEVDVAMAEKYANSHGIPISLIPGAGHSIDNEEGIATLLKMTKEFFEA